MKSKNFDNLCSIFVENFDQYIYNLNRLTEVCNKIAKLDAINKKIPCNYKIVFRETSRLGQIAVVEESQKNIFFNLTRLRIIFQKQIVTDTKEGLESFLRFKEEYYKNNDPSLDDGVLFGFLYNKNWQTIFNKFGNYKLLPFEILHTIFHENQHIAQIEYKNKVVLSNDYDKAQQNPYSLFVCIFQEIYDSLNKENLLGTYIRKNEFFPIEIDAEFFARLTLNSITINNKHQEFLIHWENFTNRFGNILSAKAFADTILENYMYLYNLYEKTFGDKYSAFNQIILKNKKDIMQFYIKIYNEYNK